MKAYKTDLKCPICSKELSLIEEIYRDEEGFKDVDLYFECKNGCDSEILNSIDDFEFEGDKV